MKKILLENLPKYIHISKNNKFLLNKIKQIKNTIKPIGLYYSYGVEWIKYLIDILNIKYIKITNKYIYYTKINLYKLIISNSYKINIYKSSNKNKILIIRSFNELFIFHNKYKYKNNNIINWIKVSNKYGGFGFTKNYVNIQNKIYINKSFNNPLLWATSFDVSGGCIWNIKLLKYSIL